MHILVVKNVAGQLNRLKLVLARVQNQQIDAIFVLGNLASPHQVMKQPPNYAEILDVLDNLQMPVYLIPGDQDLPLFALSQAIQAYRGVVRMHLVHRHAAHLKDDVVAGFGGYLTNGKGGEVDKLHFSAWEAHAAFDHLAHYNTGFQQAQRRIFLFATPPQGLKSERNVERMYGSQDVNRLVRTYQPHLVCYAGPAGTRSSERLAGTLFVNPGSVADGSYALVDLDQLSVRLERLTDVLPPETGQIRSLMVAFDGSAQSWRALELAAGLARQFDAEITLVYAFEQLSPSLGSPYADAVLGERIAQGEYLLQTASDYLADVRVQREVLEGPAADVIVHLAETRQVDMIVMGAHGYGRVRSLLGSVSAHVLRCAPCPVLLARQGPRTPALQERVARADMVI